MNKATLFQVCVADLAEARLAISGGADIVAFSGGDINLARAIVREAEGAATCASLGRIAPEDFEPAVAALAAIGVGTVDAAIEGNAAERFAAIARVSPLAKIIAVCFAEDGLGPSGRMPAFAALAKAGCHGVVLDTRDKPAKRLIDNPGINALEGFIDGARACGLSPRIAGGLEPPDVPRMLALDPDVLAFRTSLCFKGRRDGALDPARVAMMRALIPRGDAKAPAEIDSDPRALAPDRVFVRDFIVKADVGAYGYEREGSQRLRFNVEADLASIPENAADMRDIFSYDVIVDAILLATQKHTILVEALAQEVAAASLRDARVRRVRVRVEKLDILDGSVGVEIERQR